MTAALPADDFQTAFRAAGAPWPSHGIIEPRSLYSSAIVARPLGRPWEVEFFTGRELGTKIGGDEPWPDTNVVDPHRYNHDFVLIRVGINFRIVGKDPPGPALLAYLQGYGKLRTYLGSKKRPMRELPRWVPAGTTFYADFAVRQSKSGCGDGPDLLCQCVFDALIVRT